MKNDLNGELPWKEIVAEGLMRAKEKEHGRLQHEKDLLQADAPQLLGSTLLEHDSEVLREEIEAERRGREMETNQPLAVPDVPTVGGEAAQEHEMRIALATMRGQMHANLKEALMRAVEDASETRDVPTLPVVIQTTYEQLGMDEIATEEVQRTWTKESETQVIELLLEVAQEMREVLQERRMLARVRDDLTYAKRNSAVRKSTEVIDYLSAQAADVMGYAAAGVASLRKKIQPSQLHVSRNQLSDKPTFGDGITTCTEVQFYDWFVGNREDPEQNTAMESLMLEDMRAVRFVGWMMKGGPRPVY